MFYVNSNICNLMQILILVTKQDKVRSNLHYFVHVVCGKEVDSGTRVLNFTYDFDIGHKEGVLQLAC